MSARCGRFGERTPSGVEAFATNDGWAGRRGVLAVVGSACLWVILTRRDGGKEMRLFKTTVSTPVLASACGMFLLIGPGCGVGIVPSEFEDLALGVASGKTSLLEAPRCDSVSGDGATAVDDEEGVFEGSGIVFIRGEEFDVSIRTIIVDGPIEGDDGTLRATTSHEFTFDDGSSFTTTDKAILEPAGPPGLFNLNSNMKITSATGIFEGVRGRLHAHGQVDLFDEDNGVGFPDFGEASFTTNGVICLAGE